MHNGHASIKQGNGNEDIGVVYHVFDVETTHGTTVDALKGGIKIVALLLDDPPPL